MIGKFAMTAAFGTVVLFAQEIYPTNVRYRLLYTGTGFLHCMIVKNVDFEMKKNFKHVFLYINKNAYKHAISNVIVIKRVICKPTCMYVIIIRCDRRTSNNKHKKQSRNDVLYKAAKPETTSLDKAT